jgi:hypothetical protein
MFARHARRFATQNRVSGRFEGPEFWRFTREGLIRYTPTGLLAQSGAAATNAPTLLMATLLHDPSEAP